MLEALANTIWTKAMTEEIDTPKKWYLVDGISTKWEEGYGM